MRCQHVDEDIQCRLDAARRVLVGCGDPPDPDQSGFAGTVYLVQVCQQHDPAAAWFRANRPASEALMTGSRSWLHIAVAPGHDSGRETA
jgi:hypothetical protein